jgi:hypothetical protein
MEVKHLTKDLLEYMALVSNAVEQMRSQCYKV